MLGSLGCLIPLGLWLATGSDFWQAATFIGLFLNLFNLLPILPLDGGRAVAALHPAMWLVGLAGLIGLVFLTPNPILLIIVVLGGLELWNRWRHRDTPEARAYYRVRPWQRVAVAVTYVGLAVSLGVAMDLTHVERDL